MRLTIIGEKYLEIPLNFEKLVYPEKLKELLEECKKFEASFDTLK
jgi:hypothetical protein